jgi:DNA gyrase/topoisomerase IV subunit A
MRLNEIIEKQLNERSVKEIAEDWYSFRHAYMRLLKSSSKEAARRYAETWLGAMWGYENIGQLKQMLKNAGSFDSPEADKLLLMTVDNIFQKRKEEEDDEERERQFKKEKREWQS